MSLKEDVLGLRLPTLRTVEFDTADYALLATPFWFDDLVICLKDMATSAAVAGVSRRIARMQGAVRVRVTQRVNLFEKVLIPNATGATVAPTTPSPSPPVGSAATQSGPILIPNPAGWRLPNVCLFCSPLRPMITTTAARADTSPRSLKPYPHVRVS